MKYLWLTPDSMNMEPVVATLPGAVFNYMSVPPDRSAWAMLDAVMREAPDAVIYIGVSAGDYFPHPDVFKAMLVPVYHICCDASCPGWSNGLNVYRHARCFTRTINIDGNDNWEKGPNDVTLWCPLSEKFYEEKPEKDIWFGFAGGLGPERQRLTDRLMESTGLRVMPRNEKWGSYHEYANFLSRCRHTINMAKSGSGLALQTKNRVREAGLAGCVLLEEKGAPTSNWFTLGEDYLEYENAEDARRIIVSLSHAERDQLANNLANKTRTLYSSENFWKKAFGLG